jgi:hypothetical protein
MIYSFEMSANEVKFVLISYSSFISISENNFRDALAFREGGLMDSKIGIVLISNLIKRVIRNDIPF